MNQQKEDLEKSIADLQRTIIKLNRICRLRFKESFEEINEKFQSIFPRLFRGGKARLVLTDESDYLEAGVDIVVQPPGKKLQFITLLSGGEKALTAVSLLFAIFLTKPSPFCFLDEVDAPLDDANIDRFNDMSSNEDAMLSSLDSTRYRESIVSNRRGHSTFFRTSVNCWAERSMTGGSLLPATLPIISSKKPKLRWFPVKTSVLRNISDSPMLRLSMT